MKLVLLVLLALVSWPLALLVVLLYPIVWLVGIPLRVIGISVSAALELIASIIRLPARILRGPTPAR